MRVQWKVTIEYKGYMAHINYENLIDKAMFIIVKKSLMSIKDNKAPGEHHFYISFLTKSPEVHISKKLLEQYPEEMTIVIQHQFENLEIDEDKFSITLMFNGVKEDLEIPYSALTAFADPSVKFGLQFKHANKEAKLDNEVDATSEEQEEILKKGDKSNSDNVVDISDIRRSKHG